MKKSNIIQTKKAYRTRSITAARLTMSASENDIFDMLLTYIDRDDDIDSNLFYRLNIADFKRICRLCDYLPGAQIKNGF